MNKKAFISIFIILITILVIGVFFITKKNSPTHIEGDVHEDRGGEISKKEDSKEMISALAEDTVEATSWDDYTKPEGWVTMESREYGFQVDHPQDWRHNRGSKDTGIAERSLITVTSSNTSSGITFNVYRQDVHNGKPYTPIPFEEQFLPLADNQGMIDQWGEAFRYFRGAYSQEVKDDLVQVLQPLSKRTEDDYIGDNYIDIYIRPTSQTPEKDLEIMKAIIKSFRMSPN